MPSAAAIELNHVSYQPHELPIVFFGRRKPVAYVHNAKAACTLALNFLFFANHDYAYFEPDEIHSSKFAFVRLGPEYSPDQVKAFNGLAPETFSIVRDPLQRFLSGFVSKIFSKYDANYAELRDLLTSVHGIDLSPDANPAKSCLAFARVLGAQIDVNAIDRHFRPQHLNLASDGRFQVKTVLRLEDRGAVLDYFSKWLCADNAQRLLAAKIGATRGFARDNFISNELVDIVRMVYARDYELFYDGACYGLSGHAA